MTAFHEVRFPTDISLGGRGGPEWRTDVVTLRSGFEQANSVWSASRRKYDAGYGIKDIQSLERVMAFFEERRGRFYGFRWKDHMDFKSCSKQVNTSSTDQQIGTGNGTTTTFQLVKTYGSSFAPYARAIRKPVAGSVTVAKNGVTQSSGWSVDTTTGVVTFTTAPGSGVAVTAGFHFDVPVRFDTDYLEFSLDYFNAGQLPQIPIVEIRV